MRCGDRADPVGHAWPGSKHGQAGNTGQARRCLGGEHGGLLVPDVEDAHRRVCPDSSVIQRENMPAGQGEHRLDTVPPCRGHRVRAAVRRARLTRPFVLAHAGDATGPRRLRRREMRG